jgi:hypothetical protein
MPPARNSIVGARSARQLVAEALMTSFTIVSASEGACVRTAPNEQTGPAGWTAVA